MSVKAAFEEKIGRNDFVDGVRLIIHEAALVTSGKACTAYDAMFKCIISKTLAMSNSGLYSVKLRALPLSHEPTRICKNHSLNYDKTENDVTIYEINVRLVANV